MVSLKSKADNLVETDYGMTNYRLLFRYAAPYFAYVAMGSFDGLLSIEWIYTLRLIIVTGIILRFWRWYLPITGPKRPVTSVLTGILTGVVGGVLWVLLLSPFVEKGNPAWSNQAFYLRMAASTLVVPVFEELLMRGYVFFFVLQWDAERKKGEKGAFDLTLHELTVNGVRNVYWNLPAIIVSTLIFTLGHQFLEWPASIAFGLLMAVLLVCRKDLLSCIVAHGTTNFCLAWYVYQTGNWQCW